MGDSYRLLIMIILVFSVQVNIFFGHDASLEKAKLVFANKSHVQPVGLDLLTKRRGTDRSFCPRNNCCCVLLESMASKLVPTNDNPFVFPISDKIKRKW